MTTSAKARDAGCRAQRDAKSLAMTPPADDDLRASIRSIPDYPKPGIMFRDITTLLGDARRFAAPSMRWCSPGPA